MSRQIHVHQLAPNPTICFGVDGHSKFKGKIDTAVFFSKDTYLSTKNLPKILMLRLKITCLHHEVANQSITVCTKTKTN